MINPLIQRAVARTARRLGRSIPALAVGLAALGALALALSSQPGVGNGARVSRGYALLVWCEFVLVSVLALVEGGASIADERRAGTWDSVCLTDLSGGELTRGKLLGSLLAAALVVLLAAPAHFAFAARGATRWDTAVVVHAVILGTALAVGGIGVMASAGTDRALHGVSLAAAAVLFPWFGVLDFLAGRGVVPSLCRILQPIRYLEWLLGAAPPDRPAAIAARVTGYLAFTGLISAGSAIIAARWLRRPADRLSIRLWVRAGRRRIRSVGDDPLRWRETYDPGGRRVVTLVGMAALILIVGLTVSAWDSKAPGVTRGLSGSSNGYLLILTLTAGVVVGLRSAVTLVDERVRGTLDLLRLAGVEPLAMIRSKLAAILTPALGLMPVLAVVTVLGYGERLDDFVSPLAWLGAAGNVAVALVHALLVAAMSLLISAHARSARVALILEGILLFGVTLGTFILGVAASPFLPDSIALGLAASSPIYQVSLVGAHATRLLAGAHATRFPVPVSVPMLLGILGAECAIGLAAIAWTALLLAHRAPPAVVRATRRDPADSSGPRPAGAADDRP